MKKILQRSETATKWVRLQPKEWDSRQIRETWHGWPLSVPGKEILVNEYSLNEVCIIFLLLTIMAITTMRMMTIIIIIPTAADTPMEEETETWKLTFIEWRGKAECNIGCRGAIKTDIALTTVQLSLYYMAFFLFYWRKRTKSCSKFQWFHCFSKLSSKPSSKSNCISNKAKSVVEVP